jgi:hypothetical protein
MDEEIKLILEKFPFLAYGLLNDVPYLGVVQNCDGQMISIYVLGLIPTEAERKEFLALSEIWWWESNRQIPINIFLKEKFRQFRPYLKHFSRKDFDLKAGPIVSLQETIARRVRKRQVMLVRRI